MEKNNVKTHQIRPNLKNVNRSTEVKKKQKVSSNLEDLFKDKEDSKLDKEGSQVSKETNHDTVISTTEWKQTYRKTDSIELVSLIQQTSVSHNAFLRITGSYSTKMLSNLKINSKELSGIEKRPTKVFYNRELDIKQAIRNNQLSYIPYYFNHLSSLEDDTRNKLYLDNLHLINDKLYLSLYLYPDRVLEAECLVITREDVIESKINVKDTSHFLKIFITEEREINKVISTIKQNLKEDFILIVLNRETDTMSASIYSNHTMIACDIENVKEAFKEKIGVLEDKTRYEHVKSKYEFERRQIM